MALKQISVLLPAVIALQQRGGPCQGKALVVTFPNRLVSIYNKSVGGRHMSGEARRPTIIDIARMAGVSKSTVSRALSGAENISEDARQRVLDVVKSAGYQRNQMAQSLRSGRTGMLGLVIPDIANPFWAEVARGAQDRAAELSSTLLIFSSDWKADRQAAHLKALLQARVDGAIVNPVDDSIETLDRFGTPTVLIGSSAENFPEISSVGSDIVQGVNLGMSHLFAMGHRRPILLVAASARRARVRFMRAIQDYYELHGEDHSQLVAVNADYTVESGFAAMQDFLKTRAGDEQISVFAANDLMALGAMLAVRDAGLHCPGDVSILGFDGIPGGVFSDPGLTTVEKPAREIGVTAVDLLLDNIADKRAHRRIVLPCRLVERGSLRNVLADVVKAKTAALGQ